MLVNEYKTQIPSNSELTFLLNELLSKRDQELLSVNSKPKPELIPEIDAEHIEQQLFDVETSIKDMELNKVPVFDFDVK
ncbi:hypothetical protein Q5762_38405, partial [Streptomyces sp. P9(2023)]|uniref:hypothetical protein n=1 Tax=Streptomyces sp. P9(2023) TaxID=3064394 RepID=UPI0028F3EF48